MYHSHSDDFDTECLIKEVEKLPELYNSKIPEYKDRKYRIAAWKHVCEQIYDNWKSLSVEDKREKNNTVRRRWKSLRNCFTRELSLRKRNDAKGIICKKRKYRYFTNMEFLLDTVHESRLARISPTPDDNDTSMISNDATEEEQTDQFLQNVNCGKQETKTLKMHVEELFHKREKQPSHEQTTTKQTEPTDQLQNNSQSEQKNNAIEIDIKELFSKLEKHPNEEIDDDKHFLLSLLPIIKKFDDDDKINVRIEIMRAIKNIQNKSLK